MLEMRIIYVILVGLFFGIMVGSTGIFPGGAIALILYNLGVFNDFKLSLGTLTFVLVLPFAIGGLYEYNKAGKIDYKIGLLLFLMTAIGSYLGSKISFSLKLPDKFIEYAQSIIFFILSIFTLNSAINTQ
jgi:uncharacterized membrane protein YfcA